MRSLTFALSALAVAAFGQEFKPPANFFSQKPHDKNELAIASLCVPGRPWTVAGEHGGLLGRQNGVFEAWQWPVKLLSNFRIKAELADYTVPIDVNALAADIRVTPAETTITYSHAAFTIKQHMFASRGEANPALGAALVFEIQSIRPLDVDFSFTPDMLHMWPAPNHGRPNGEWIASPSGGFYILHTDDPNFSALVAMPHTKPGIQVPYQEHPQTYPLELMLHFDPKADAQSVFPLILAVQKGDKPGEQVAAALSSISDVYAKTQAYYQSFFDKRLTISTPNSLLNEALSWAEVAIDQTQVKYHDETGLIAGYYESADSARPGYAWFFGRDTLWTTYAINSYGDFALTKRALDFLFARQREDGKIMHEYSQSADALDWKQTPYFYASADSTPILVMAMWDYVRLSGDVEYLKAHWTAIQKAYRFTRSHAAQNGIYSNTEGTGWVESWPQGMPKQEIYMAAVDGQSSRAVSHLAALMGDGSLAAEGTKQAADIASKIESQFYSSADQFYAFSRNDDGSLDRTLSIYPAVSWWDGTLYLTQAGPMLSRWASTDFSTDWGTRDISSQTSFFDPISYHQGSIWPLFTGWVSLAEYRAGRPLSAYAHLMQNAGMTWTQDLGSVTELLSGEFFQPLGRSSSHQLWSSAMVISPLLRGLFGLDWDAPNHTVRLAPHLPADWDSAEMKNVRLGDAFFDLKFRRTGSRLTVDALSDTPQVVCLTKQTREDAKPCSRPSGRGQTLVLDLPPVELAIPAELPQPGAETRQLKAIDEKQEANQATFTFDGYGGTAYELPIRLNRTRIAAQGATIAGGKLQLRFPDGAGYHRQQVRFSW